MAFFNRFEEMERLAVARGRERSQCIVVYGRRRCGKSTLLREAARKGDVYFMATQTEAALQRRQLAREIDRQLPGFARGEYTDWADFFAALAERPKQRFALTLDEFPYLVRSDSSLPSILQRLLEDRAALNIDLILCGSSQQMMQDYILHAAAPLYGRADEIIKVAPLRAGWLTEQFSQQSAQRNVIEYATWGGVPRYWELRANYGDYVEAVRKLVLDPSGILHDEPTRLLLDDMRDSALSSSLLSVVANGAHKLREIGSRLNKASTDLNRPLNRLISLGYLKREKPFGAGIRDKKRNLYNVRDPFMRFYYRYVHPAASELELGLIDQVANRIPPTLSGFVSYEWEELCRTAVSLGALPGQSYKPARRWWGKDTNGQPREIDIVAESTDGNTLLLGECKWSAIDNPDALAQSLREMAPSLPFYRGQRIETVIAPMTCDRLTDTTLLLPEAVLRVLR